MILAADWFTQKFKLKAKSAGVGRTQPITSRGEIEVRRSRGMACVPQEEGRDNTKTPFRNPSERGRARAVAAREALPAGNLYLVLLCCYRHL